MLNFFSRYELLGMPKPDCIIFLDVTPAKAEALINARPTDSRSYLVDQTDHKDKLHVKSVLGFRLNAFLKRYETNRELQQHVRDAYLQVADVSVWHIINTLDANRGLKTVDEIQSEIRANVNKSFTRVVSEILF